MPSQRCRRSLASEMAVASSKGAKEPVTGGKRKELSSPAPADKKPKIPRIETQTSDSNVVVTKSFYGRSASRYLNPLERKAISNEINERKTKEESSVKPLQQVSTNVKSDTPKPRRTTRNVKSEKPQLDMVKPKPKAENKTTKEATVRKKENESTPQKSKSPDKKKRFFKTRTSPRKRCMSLGIGKSSVSVHKSKGFSMKFQPSTRRNNREQRAKSLVVKSNKKSESAGINHGSVHSIGTTEVGGSVHSIGRTEAQGSVKGTGKTEYRGAVKGTGKTEDRGSVKGTRRTEDGGSVQGTEDTCDIDSVQGTEQTDLMAVVSKRHSSRLRGAPRSRSGKSSFLDKDDLLDAFNMPASHEQSGGSPSVSSVSPGAASPEKSGGSPSVSSVSPGAAPPEKSGGPPSVSSVSPGAAFPEKSGGSPSVSSVSPAASSVADSVNLLPEVDMSVRNSQTSENSAASVNEIPPTPPAAAKPQYFSIFQRTPKSTPRGKSSVKHADSPSQRSVTGTPSSGQRSVKGTPSSGRSAMGTPLGQRSPKRIGHIETDGKEQMMLDCGQKLIGPVQCSTCGMTYSHAEPGDETTHSKFHQGFLSALKFPGWKKERVLQEFPEGSRIIMILPDDKVGVKKFSAVKKIVDADLGFVLEGSALTPHSKVFFFISSEKRVTGVCVAESIKQGYRVVADGDSQASQGQAQPGRAPLCCGTTPLPAKCGINRIWVLKNERRAGIASRLADAVRKHFLMGYLLDKSQMAFSDPTPDGKSFAARYSSNPAFLVYKHT